MAQSATKNPAIRKRGGDPDVKEHKAPHGKPKDEALDQKLVGAVGGHGEERAAEEPAEKGVRRGEEGEDRRRRGDDAL